MGSPCFPLGEVFELVRSRQVWFSTKSRSVFAVVQVYAETNLPKTLTEAEEFITSDTPGGQLRTNRLLRKTAQ